MFDKTKNLILLRGLPGAGKTMLAHALSGGLWPVFSVDDYFTSEDGSYHFLFEQNHLAYRQCETNTEAAMSLGAQKIFVHNTFVYDWEMEPYFKMASHHDYTLHILTVEHYHNGKNLHDVSEEQLNKMAGKFSVKLL